MYKYKKAQQLVEFVVVAPIIIVIFIFIVEIGFTINAKIALSEAVRYSLIKVNQMADDSVTDIETALENSIKSYLSSHYLPNSSSITVDIITPSAGSSEETAVVKVNYKYLPFFTLFDSLGNSIIPSELDFSSYQIVNYALLKQNTPSSVFTSAQLDSFSKDSSIITNQTIDGVDFRYQVAFMVGFSGGATYDYARLYNWWGEDLLPSNLAFSMQSGHLIVKTPYYPTTPAGNWLDTNIPYTWVLSSLGFTQAIYSYNLTNNTIFSLFLNGSDPFGSFDPMNSLSGSVNLQTVKGYTFNYNNTYVLKLFIPNNTRPTDTYNGYNFQFNLDSNGEYTVGSGTTADIVDCYIDSDGDGIPDAWDQVPAYPDSDGDGLLDGQLSTIGSAVSTPTLPDDIADITASAVASSIIILSNISIATPFKVDGSLNPHSLNSFAPPLFSINRIQYTSGSYTALYFQKNGNQYTRKMTPISSLNDKVNFIKCTVDLPATPTTINLNTSTELSSLDIGAFSSKVGH